MSLPSGVYVTRYDLNPVVMVTSMGRSLAGYEQPIAGPDALWTGSLDVTVPRSAWPAWVAWIDGQDGGVTGFTLAMSDLSASFAYPSGSPTVAADASALSAVVRVTHTGQAAAWALGMMFNLNGLMHRVIGASVVDANTVDLTVRPRLRTAASTSDALSAASVVMRLADPNAGRIRRGGVSHDTLTLPLVERFAT